METRVGFPVIFSWLRWPIKPKFSQVCYFILSCDTQSVGLGQYCLTKVSNGFKSCWSYFSHNENWCLILLESSVLYKDVHQYSGYKAMQCGLVCFDHEVIPPWLMNIIACITDIHHSMGFTIHYPHIKCMGCAVSHCQG